VIIKGIGDLSDDEETIGQTTNDSSLVITIQATPTV